MGHMNGDHGSSLKQYVEVLVGCAPVKRRARMKRLDRLGFDVRVEDAESFMRRACCACRFDEE